MVRKLKYHEQKLLKKVDFLNVSSFLTQWNYIHYLCPVETRRKSTGDKGNEEISHTRQRRLPQARIPSISQTHGLILILRYNKLCGSLRSFAHRLSLLPAQDPFRSRMEAQLLSKLYDMGVLNTLAKLSDIENKLTVAAFCRRRLAVFMCMSKMSETVSAVCCCRTGSLFIFSHFPRCASRPLNSSSKAMFVLDPILSQILPSW